MPPQGAHTPEELDYLLEDAALLRDRAALSLLFERDALCVLDGHQVRGNQFITTSLLENGYVAAPRHVLQRGGTALVVGASAVHVAHRGEKGWRFTISLLLPAGCR
ncbi:hypothetical protein ACSHWB_39580 [Lentzea sp. HUAS TT2]|uniref:hypothetical protein n=1 Tax=Lentzea sp. HUAS TT2 TaxID=3447454 RepID=UPI003F71588C